jgi:hypothetical protein
VCIDSGTLLTKWCKTGDPRPAALKTAFCSADPAIDKHTGKVEGRPEIVTRGFMSLEESVQILENARGSDQDAGKLPPPKSAAIGA